jgi:hypothetical protein
MSEEARTALKKRSAARRRVDKLGQIEFAGFPAVSCVIRNISDTGALLMVRKTRYLPKELTLVIPEDRFSRKARVMWRRAKSIGVKFL